MPLSVASSVEWKSHFHPGAAAIDARMSFFLKWKLLQYLGHWNVSSVTGGASANLTMKSVMKAVFPLLYGDSPRLRGHAS